MAKVIDNPIIAGLSGKLGKWLVIRHMRDGRTIVLMRPDFSNRVFSGKQLDHQSRFQAAAAYAKAAAKTEPIYAMLAAGSGTPAYNIALSDWFKPPVIHAVTQRNGRISVHVTDNVQVTAVRIAIVDEQGQLQEEGQAAPGQDDSWEYETSAAGKVIVEAHDLAGNVTRLEA